MFDVLIKSGFIIDGTGNPWFKADVGIEAGKIKRIGKLSGERANRIIDAHNLAVSPGFIDIHNHGDYSILKFPTADNLIMQGVTTAVVGNCGTSPAPVSIVSLDLLKESMGYRFELDWDWRSFGEFLRRIEQNGTAINIAPLVGHGSIRAAVMGMEDREPTNKELQEMKQLLAQSLKDGAFGMSTGLIYPPGVYAKTPELIELAKVVAEYGGIYASHVRGEADTLVEAVEEAIKIAEEAGLPVELSHHKAMGRKNWGKVSETLDLMEKARERGVEVTCDVYPYTAGSTNLTALLPPWVLVGGAKEMVKRLKDPETREHIREDMEKGRSSWDSVWCNIPKEIGWENIVISLSTKNKDLENRNLAEIAQSRNEDPYETLFNLLIEEAGQTETILFQMSEEDVSTVVLHRLSMICSDGFIQNINSAGKPHPRTYGAFARIFAQYVRKGALTLEEAVRKMTSMPACKVGLLDRGLIREGMWADIVIFDPQKIIDRATYADPQQYPLGVNYVLVNGKVVVEEGKHSGTLPGKVLRKVGLS